MVLMEEKNEGRFWDIPFQKSRLSWALWVLVQEFFFLWLRIGSIFYNHNSAVSLDCSNDINYIIKLNIIYNQFALKRPRALPVMFAQVFFCKSVDIL